MMALGVQDVYCHISVTGSCDSNKLPKTVFLMSKRTFSKEISNTVICVTLSQGSRFTMEYISIRRVTRPVFPSYPCDSVTQMTEILLHAKTSVFDALRGNSDQLLLSQEYVTLMRQYSLIWIRGPHDGTHAPADHDTDRKDNSVSTSLDTIEATQPTAPPSSTKIQANHACEVLEAESLLRLG